MTHAFTPQTRCALRLPLIVCAHRGNSRLRATSATDGFWRNSWTSAARQPADTSLRTPLHQQRRPRRRQGLCVATRCGGGHDAHPRHRRSGVHRQPPLRGPARAGPRRPRPRCLHDVLRPAAQARQPRARAGAPILHPRHWRLTAPLDEALGWSGWPTSRASRACRPPGDPPSPGTSTATSSPRSACWRRRSRTASSAWSTRPAPGLRRGGGCCPGRATPLQPVWREQARRRDPGRRLRPQPACRRSRCASRSTDRDSARTWPPTASSSRSDGRPRLRRRQPGSRLHLRGRRRGRDDPGPVGGPPQSGSPRRRQRPSDRSRHLIFSSTNRRRRPASIVQCDERLGDVPRTEGNTSTAQQHLGWSGEPTCAQA